MSQTAASGITQLIINDLVTCIGESPFAVQDAPVFSKVLDLPGSQVQWVASPTGLEQCAADHIEATEAGLALDGEKSAKLRYSGIAEVPPPPSLAEPRDPVGQEPQHSYFLDVDIQKHVSFAPNFNWDLQTALPCKANSELHLADGAQLSTPVIRRQFLNELLRDCSFFAHLVFRKVREVHRSSKSLAQREVPRPRWNSARISPMQGRSSSDIPLERLPPEVLVPSMPTLWVEIGSRHVRAFVPEKEHDEYAEDSKPTS